jgi:membrane fusion protein (multidrug efflux system)
MSEPDGSAGSLRWWLLAGAALLVVGGVVLGSTAPSPEQVAPVGQGGVSRAVGTIRVAPVPVVTRARVSGVLEPRRSVQIFAETRGPVTAIGAEALDRVEAGLELVAIDPLQAEVAVERAVAAVARAESELALAKSNFDRRNSLAERGVTSTSVLEDAQNANKVGLAVVRDARAELKRARDDLAKKSIRAPFEGVLRSFEVDVGEYVQAGQKLGELLDTRTARVTIGLRDRDIVAVRPDQAVEVHVEAYPGEVFSGRVLRVGAASDAQSRQFPIEVEVPNDDGRLLPGMVAIVELEFAESGDRILIPRDAAVEEFGMRSVFVVEASAGDGGEVARRRRVVVRPLPFRPSEFEVVSGLEPGQQVVVTGARRLRDGDAVQSTAQPSVERTP